ncbi:MAG: hypothetical protein IPI49_03980 [Myxococcales bacterium]|nr:hypothetical protein [Myxococcales bacterium]
MQVLDRVEPSAQRVELVRCELAHALQRLVQVLPHPRRSVQRSVHVCEFFLRDGGGHHPGRREVDAAWQHHPPGLWIFRELPSPAEPAPQHLAEVGPRGQDHQLHGRWLISRHAAQVVIKDGQGLAVVLERDLQRALHIDDGLVRVFLDLTWWRIRHRRRMCWRRVLVKSLWVATGCCLHRARRKVERDLAFDIESLASRRYLLR